MIIFNYTIQGADHIKKNKECQDYSGSCSFKSRFNLEDDVQVIVVADGHGGNDYVRSSFGSKFAVEAAKESVEDFAKKVFTGKMFEDKNNVILQNLAKKILKEWYSKVIEHYRVSKLSDNEIEIFADDKKNKYLTLNQNFDENDNVCVHELAKLYGTTLILFVYMNDCCFGMQIGDGRCIAFDNDLNSFEPMPLHERCFFNKTTSICDKDAIDEFVYYVSKEKPKAVFLGSDGIDDSYSNIDEVSTLYLSIIKAFSEKDENDVRQEIQNYMHTITEKGSGDDVSMAGIII